MYASGKMTWSSIELIKSAQESNVATSEPSLCILHNVVLLQSVVTSQPSIPPSLPPFSAPANPYGQMAANSYSAYMQPRMPYTSLSTGQPPLPPDNKSPLPTNINTTSKYLR